MSAVDDPGSDGLGGDGLGGDGLGGDGLGGDGLGATNGTRRGVSEPAHLGDEATALVGFLQRQRDLVAWKVRGCAEGRLRSVSTPTGLTVHGVVRHLTNVERSWVRGVFAGEEDLSYDWTPQDPDGELHVPEGVTVEELLADYAAEAHRCDAVVRGAHLHDHAARGDMALRWVLLHLLEETSRHLGHLDLLREQADGATGEEPAG